MNEILVKKTDIEGLLVVHTAIQQNPSGWFTENWHQEKMSRVGVRDFTPVQHNITYVDKRGTTRGFHAEPWDRYISVLSGRAFMAWLDLREGPTHGRTHVRELGPGTSVFVPKGVGNAHQVLEAGTTFSYHLAEHWTLEASQRSKVANLYDPGLGINWPIAQEDAILSERDLHAPYISAGSQRESEPFSMLGATSMTEPRASGTGGGPYRVLFVCTANICRSAYADVVARSRGIGGIEFLSAGTHALVGQPIDPPIANQVADPADPSSHRAQQLTRELVESADLILAMGSEHRRYILDEWPSAARKTFIIGHAAREVASIPADAGLHDVADHLWHHRSTGPRDEVEDPYRRGDGAAIKAATTIDTHLEDILPRLQEMIARR